jgi:hypothetical protein
LRQSIVVDIEFLRRDDGQIDVFLGADWVVFNEALSDAVSSLPPTGSMEIGPSTYWIDVASLGAERAAQDGSSAPFAWGNVTYLRVEAGSVIAAYDFDADETEAESMPLTEFLDFLARWRGRVIAAQAHAAGVIPNTGRRNPF